MNNTHTTASHIVAEMRYIPNSTFDPNRRLIDVVHCLEFKSPLFAVRVSFTEIIEDPAHMWMRSSNRRAEDEPYGLLSKSKAREIYRKLLAHGFTAV